MKEQFVEAGAAPSTEGTPQTIPPPGDAASACGFLRDKPVYGGQAVIEGVMMRGKHFAAAAVRREDGEIVVRTEPVSGLVKRYPWINKPFLRGVFTLFDALAIGFRSLRFSADVLTEELMQQEKTDIDGSRVSQESVGERGVRVTDPETGLSVESTRERTRERNRERAVRILRGKIGRWRNLAEVEAARDESHSREHRQGASAGKMGVLRKPGLDHFKPDVSYRCATEAGEDGAVEKPPRTGACRRKQRSRACQQAAAPAVASGRSLTVAARSRFFNSPKDASAPSPAVSGASANAATGTKTWTNVMMGITLAVAVVFVIVVPHLARKWVIDRIGLEGQTYYFGPLTLNFGSNIVEGLIRFALFLVYVWGIGFIPDIRRVFQYHGAEHKTVHGVEAGVELTRDALRRFPCVHPRCGTNFIVIVICVKIVLFSFLEWENIVIRIVSRLALLPVVAAISYEVLRLAGKLKESRLMRAVMAPGLYMQRLTTRAPTDDQVEVAILAMKETLRLEMTAGERNA